MITDVFHPSVGWKTGWMFVYFCAELCLGKQILSLSCAVNYTGWVPKHVLLVSKGTTCPDEDNSLNRSKFGIELVVHESIPELFFLMICFMKLWCDYSLFKALFSDRP